MFRIINLEEINEDISRKTGDTIITRVCEVVKANLSNEYIFVSYMGPKFAIAFSGIDEQSVLSFIQELKEKIERISIEPVDIEFETGDEEEEVTVQPKINIVLSTYYKGTALEGVLKTEEEYLDKASKSQSEINML